MRKETLVSRSRLLNNEFPTTGKYQFPIVYKQNINIENIELRGFHSLNKGDENSQDIGIHFFIEDWRFDPIVKNPEKYIEKFKQYRFITSIDLSLWTDMNRWQLIYQVGKRRWLDAKFQASNVNVIPAIGWASKDSFKYCFDGIQHGSIVAVSTNGAQKQKLKFLAGFAEMCAKLEPETVLCYGSLFYEMYKYCANIKSFPLDSARRARSKNINVNQLCLPGM